ncbi:MAG: hypothetical protein U0228_38550 [Myxococcaceae bacterium]
MHPLIARFIDLTNAVATLEKNGFERTLDADEAAYVRAADRMPQARVAILKAKGKAKPSSDVQQQLIVVATRAAALRATTDRELGPRIETARAALLKEGASESEADDLIAQAVLEEAFGYAEDPGHFDAPYLAETIESLAHLAPITQDTVDEWLETFAKEATAEARALQLKVAELMLESAWSEGPQPITPEHVDETLELIADAVAQTEFTRALETLQRFLAFLGKRHVIGPTRLERLAKIVSTASAAGAEVDEEVDEDEDEG